MLTAHKVVFFSFFVAFCVLLVGSSVFVLWFVNQAELRDANEVRMFKVGLEDNMMCVVFLDEYKSHVYRFVDEHKLDRCLIGLFLNVSNNVTQ